MRSRKPGVSGVSTASATSALVIAAASGAAISKLVDNPRGGGVEPGGRADLVDESDAQRLGGGKTLAGQRQPSQDPRAEAVDEQRDDRRRGDAPTHLADRKDRILGGDHDVAGSGDPDPAAKAAAMDHRDRRVLEMPQAVDRRHGAAREVEILFGRRRARAGVGTQRSAPA